MCGIFGAVVGGDSALADPRSAPRYIRQLFELSESRGKEAAGMAIANDDQLVIYKQPIPATEFIETAPFESVLRDAFTTHVASASNGTPRPVFIGHSRLVTDGTRDANRNNQPVRGDGIVGIHNGIVVNHESLWSRHDGLERHYEIDSEVIFALLREQLAAGLDLEQATARTFGEIEGAASIAALFEDRDELLLATNNGSLYYRQGAGNGAFVFTSEDFILREFIRKNRLEKVFGSGQSVAVLPGEGVIVDLKTLAVRRFEFGAAELATSSSGPQREQNRETIDRSPPDRARSAHVRRADVVDFDAVASRFPHRSTTHTLRRCSRCILPETMPFIEFDSAGVCNYCRNYQPNILHGPEELARLVAPHRKRKGPDCVVAVSGGRDSIYGLHYVKTVLGMNPTAYTYDWGMVTDLARRNVSRICGKLGIEHILVSADIDAKRANVRKNVDAWLERPSLGTIPLFMAGDKAYFYFLGKVCEQLGTDLSFLCENLLERSDFKTGFAGIAPQIVDKDHTYTLGLRSKVDLISFFLKEFAKNRRYINSSLLDSAKAFAFFYIRKRTDHNLFRYVPWEEEELVSTIRNEYDFELAPDTNATWRIGDGTAAFYNYIYHCIAGFTENDTFRSNQIRAGAIDRETALREVDEENQPRFESIKWYLDTIGTRRSLLDVLDIINRVPKLYEI